MNCFRDGKRWEIRAQPTYADGTVSMGFFEDSNEPEKILEEEMSIYFHLLALVTCWSHYITKVGMKN